RVVSTRTTTFKKSRDPGGAPTGVVSYTGETDTTVTSGVSARAATPPWTLLKRSPRFEPRASTACLIGRMPPVIVSASSSNGLGVSVTIDSALSRRRRRQTPPRWALLACAPSPSPSAPVHALIPGRRSAGQGARGDPLALARSRHEPRGSTIRGRQYAIGRRRAQRARCRARARGPPRRVDPPGARARALHDGHGRGFP